LAGNTVWSTPERIRGEVLTTMRYTNRCLPLPLRLMLEDKDKDLWFEDKDLRLGDKDLWFEDKDKNLRWMTRQGLVNWSSRILEDKDFPRGQQH